MAQHYPRNTTAVLAWCNVCNRNTAHSVADRRLGGCQNSHVKEPDKRKFSEDEAQEDRQGELF